MHPLGEGSIHLQRGGAGERLLYLHGPGGGVWSELHDRLAESFEVLAPSHPAFGRSDVLEEIEGIDDLVYHYLDLLDALGWDRLHLAGVSFGAWLAAELAAHSPSRFESLVLVAPLGLRLTESPITDIFLMTPQERAATLYRDPENAPRPEPEDWEASFQSYKNMTALARYGWAPFMCDPKLERRLHRVTARTCVVHPERDAVVPMAHCERYAQTIPNAQLQALTGSAHAVDEEDPERLADAMLSFLESGKHV